jgi:cation-transporting P-type ATPase E
VTPASAAPEQPVTTARASPDDLVGAALSANGLSVDEVDARVRAGLENRVRKSSSRSLWHILRGNLLTLFNAVVGGCSLLLLALGQWQDALFGLAVLANVVIGVAQEYRAKRSLDRLTLLHAPRARVMRAGLIQDIAIERVVRDDLLVLRSGDQISADATIVGSEGLEIDQSLLTGEADPVTRGSGDEVLSGSAVVGGHATARVVRVGAASFASRLTAEAKRFSLVDSELRNSLNRIVRWISWALIPLMAIVVNGQMKALGGWGSAIATGSWRQASVSAIASIVSMVPQGLVLITSVAFAIAAVNLARDHVLVQELPAVEGLARVDVVCLDKTGTLTEGTIVFDAVHPLEPDPVPGWQQVLGWFGGDEDANATARCLRAAFPAAEVLRPVAVIPFSSARKWSAGCFVAGPAVGTWVLGAPEMVLDSTIPTHAAALRLASDLAGRGLRTLLLAQTARVLGDGDARRPSLPEALRPVAVVTFRERVRPDAAQTLAYFRAQGVGIRVISGDNPRTVAAVAREVGLTLEDDGYDARDLPTDPEQLSLVLEQHTVFGRVTPSQKKSMVSALQRSGHVVAMTGDGVNDALALKQADIGVAMGSGSDVTKAVSRLVLLDGRFSHLPDVVAEGRRVIANIELVSKLFLTKTAYAVLLAIAFGVLLWEFPFLPRQLAVVDGLTIGIPALFLALLPNQRRYIPGFLRRAVSFAIPVGLIVGTVSLALNTAARAISGDTQEASQTASVIAMSLVGLWVLTVLIRPLDRRRVLLLVCMYVGLVGCLTVPLIRDFFGLEVPPLDLLSVSIGTAIPGCLGVEIIDRLRRRRDRSNARIADAVAGRRG